MKFMKNPIKRVNLAAPLLGLVAIVILLVIGLFNLTNPSLDAFQIRALATMLGGVSVAGIMLIVTSAIVWDQNKKSKKHEEILEEIYQHMFGHYYRESSD